MRTLVLLWCVTALTLACSNTDEHIPDTSSADGHEREQKILESREGLASFVARALDGQRTASGVTFAGSQMMAAHPTYPFGTMVRVTNLENLRAVVVEIVDRGPAEGPRKEGVVIDLSRVAAEALGFVEKGRTRVRLDVLRWGERRP
jgi:rare lipoprotein A